MQHEIEVAIQDAVLSAVLHVAAASALDARDLALEFDAACLAIARLQARSVQHAQGCDSTQALSSQRFSSLAQSSAGAAADEWIEILQQRCNTVALASPAAAPQLQEYVWAAAYAAATVSAETGLTERRAMQRLSRIALAQIAALLAAKKAGAIAPAAHSDRLTILARVRHRHANARGTQRASNAWRLPGAHHDPS